MKNSMVLTRKIALDIDTDKFETNAQKKEEVRRVYKWLADSMEAQSKQMNMYMSALFVQAMQEETSVDERKELNNLYNRMKNGAYDGVLDIPSGTGIVMGQTVRQDFGTALSKGLMYGNTSLPTYKKDYPLILSSHEISEYGKVKLNKGRETVVKKGIYFIQETYADFHESLYKEKDAGIRFHYCNGIDFKIVLGDIYKSREIRDVFDNIFQGNYKICSSSLQFGKKKDNRNKIILNLAVEIPIASHELDENIVVGVDLGMAVTAMCATNNDMYDRLAIGNYDSIITKRLALQKQKRECQHAMKTNTGGHGREKKMRKYNNLRKSERNIVKNYNHYISNQVVQYALKNRAKYINIEDLSGFSDEDKKGFVLRNWSYFELQTMIEYKAKKNGIVVRKVKPAYTSQTCSVCGERGERKTQKEFICLNPKCKCHSMYKDKDKNPFFNADFNAARNIAISENWAEEKKSKKKKNKITSENEEVA